jgi:CDP-diglyceride synthetase
MLEHLKTALFLTVPLLFSGSLHMAFVRKDWLPALRRPLNPQLFGPNKTWRGFVVMIPGVWLGQAIEPLLSNPTTSLRAASGVLLGLSLGLAYMLAELPNSYIKRRLGIEAGMLPTKNKLLFAFIDQADSAVGCAIAYRLLLGAPWATVIILSLLGPFVHLLANLTLYALGLRRRPI